MERPESVLTGNDFEALETLINIHCGLDNPMILDCTYNTGKMWKNCKYQPIFTLDINPAFNPMIVGDFLALPFKSDSFDVVVFDPPFIPADADTKHSSKIYKTIYGATDDKKTRQGHNVCDLFVPFLESVKTVIKKEGILITKMGDIIHNNRYQWQQVGFVNACRELEVVPCDMLIKVGSASKNLISSKWKTVRHLRRAHSYFIVSRFNKRCGRKI